MSGTLCVVAPGRLAVTADGRAQVDPKTVSGMHRYQSSWPGDVHFVARRGPSDRLAQPFEWPKIDDLPFATSLVDDVAETLRLINPSIVLAPLQLESARLMDLRARCVLACDYPLRVRWDNARLDPNLGSIDKLRTAVGLSRRALAVRQLIRNADGLQCNGPDTYATYAPHSRNPLLYFDTRVSSEDVATAQALDAHTPSPQLRLAFSGRWIEQKGVLDAVAVTQRLHDMGHPVHLTLLGGGPLDSQLRELGHPAVSVVGRLDFEADWVPFVRDQVDIMLLPHPQGDSASTFLEAMGCGAPVAGYANRYWRLLHAKSNSGWTTPTSQPDQLVALLASLVESRGQIASARTAGLRFAAKHSFDLEFDRRVEHLLSIANT